jgi:4-hydroxybenzoate polyprenyltransferase
MGLAFAWAGPGIGSLWRLPVFVVATGLLVAHIFCLNDWAGIETDRHDINRSAHTFLARGTTHRDMGALTIGLGVASLSLFGLLSVSTFLAALGVLVLSLLYSHPLVAAKGIPIVSSVLHVAGGALHFLLGYSLSGTIGAPAILVGVYLGVVFAAGHLTQEVGDYVADRLNGIRTNAVMFGRRGTFVAAFLLFTASYAIIVGLGYVGIVPSALMAVGAFYPAHVWLFRQAFRDDLTFARVSSYRNRYRQLYVLIGLVICAVLIVGRIRP